MYNIFFGFVNFNWKFIKNCYQVASLLTQLKYKDKLKWMSQAKKAF